MTNANRQDEPAVKASRSGIADHLWWIVEVLAILACLVGWLLVRDGQLLIYALTGVILLSLVFRLCR